MIKFKEIDYQAICDIYGIEDSEATESLIWDICQLKEVINEINDETVTNVILTKFPHLVMLIEEPTEGQMQILIDSEMIHVYRNLEGNCLELFRTMMTADKALFILRDYGDENILDEHKDCDWHKKAIAIYKLEQL